MTVLLVAVRRVLALALTSVAFAAPGLADSIINIEHEARIDGLLAGMSLEQKVAQMIQPEIRWVTLEDVRRFGFGSVLNGGGSWPQMNKHATAADWLALADAFYAASVDTSAGSAGIPIIWGTDAVHGNSNVLGATLFPHNIGLGASGNSRLAGEIAVATAREVRATGQEWIFAPTVAVVADPRWGRTYESFSADGDVVAQFAAPVVTGLQSADTIASAKHFIGDGGTRGGVDQGDTALPLEELLRVHGAGYRAAIDAGVLTIMASFNSWNGSKVHGNRRLLTEVLKEELGFEGFVVSDWNGIGQVRYCSNADCAQAINAGIDMVMAPRDWRELHGNLVAQVRAGDISPARVDDAVRRILRVKLSIGLFDGRSPSQRAAQYPASLLGAPAHRALAAQAVRESLVLLKNDGAALPLQRGQHILVSGSAADDISRQSGGWTLTWQGTDNPNDDFPGASSILDGLRAVAAGEGSVVHSPDGTFSERPDVAVVAFGEIPYAEGTGDVAHLNHSRRYPEDLALLRSLRAQGIPVVAVFVTGRPAWINPELNASDAFVVAWLPGSEGAAVADVLFAQPGSAVDFQGRLPMPWPATDINPAEERAPVAETLFPLGYGLRLAATGAPLGTVSEVSLAPEPILEEVLFSRRSQPPWMMLLGDDADWTVRVSAARAASRAGRVAVEAVDHRLQEDARRISWRADPEHPAQLYWRHDAGYRVDMTAALPDSAALLLQLRVEERPEGPVQLRVDCGFPCTGAVEVGELLRGATPQDWYELRVPLACFADRGADLTDVSSPLVLSSSGSFTMTLSDVRFRDVAGDAEACGELFPVEG